VVPLGIEEVVREVSDLKEDRYLALNLPESLRRLPDFFAVNRERTQSWLIEVKFRRTWNDAVKNELGGILTEQVKWWSPMHLVLFFGESPSKYYQDQPASWVRAARLTLHDSALHFQFGNGIKAWSDVDWTHLSRVQDIFPQLNEREKWEAEVIAATLEISKGLVAIS